MPYMAHWFVYMVRCADGSLYTGISTDVASRVMKHNSGTGAKYVRGRRPVQLVWSSAMPSESAARKREAAIKSLSRTEKERLIADA